MQGGPGAAPRARVYCHRPPRGKETSGHAATDRRRLGAQELAAWRGFLRVQSSLFRELDAELTATHDLPLRSYEVLLLLEDAPQRRLRMSDLSRSVLLSPSGVTRLVDRLQREGLVDRERCPEDGRGYFAVLSDAGERRLQEARATHLAGVRRLFLDRLGADDLRRLAALLGPPGAGRRRHRRRVAPRRARARPRRAARRRCLTSSSSAPAWPASAARASCDTAGLEVLVLERSDAPGGRVRTDEVDGFLLDRGFQVLLTAYPEARRVLDYDRLALRPFESGALIRRDGRFARLADPLRHPLRALESLREAPGSLPDKLRVARLRRRLSRFSLNELLTAPQVTTAEALRREGFSSDLVDGFFRPFLGGIFLDPSLETSSRLFAFVFKLFAEGEAALPAAGMQAHPAPAGARACRSAAVRYGATVSPPAPGEVVLAGGERLTAPAVVVAADGPEAARLTGAVEAPAPRAVTTLHYAAERSPVGEPVLVLDGEGRGPVNDLCVPSDVAPSYAPPGAALVSATVLGIPPLRRTRRSTPPSAVSSAAGSARRCRAGGCCAPCASPSPCRRSLRRRSPRPSGPCASATGSSSAATTATPPRSRAPWSRAAAPRRPSAGSMRRPSALSRPSAPPPAAARAVSAARRPQALPSTTPRHITASTTAVTST